MRAFGLFSFLAAVASVARPAIGATPACTGTLTGTAASGDPFWMESIKHQGIAAFNSNPSSYQVFRNVKDFGAVGDGVADDTAAIKYVCSEYNMCLYGLLIVKLLSSSAAMSSGNRCGNGNCDSTTTEPAIVYFPPGCGNCRLTSCLSS